MERGRPGYFKIGLKVWVVRFLAFMVLSALVGEDEPLML